MGSSLAGQAVQEVALVQVAHELSQATQAKPPMYLVPKKVPFGQDAARGRGGERARGMREGIPLHTLGRSERHPSWLTRRRWRHARPHSLDTCSHPHLSPPALPEPLVVHSCVVMIMYCCCPLTYGQLAQVLFVPQFVYGPQEASQVGAARVAVGVGARADVWGR